MNRTFLKVLVLVLSLHNIVEAQYVLKNQEDVDWYNNIPQEYVIAHTNNNEFLVGEYFYYSLSCFNGKTKKLSRNSKVAYVELFGENGLIFKQKVTLRNGVGQGDYFIPSNLETGNYKLIAYTRWMKNAGQEYQSVKDIYIINPFKSLSVNESQMEISNVSSANNSNNEHPFLSLNLGKTVFSHREKVKINISNKISTSGNGIYAISVKKHEPLMVDIKSQMLRGINYKKSKEKNVGDQIYLPEYSGEMITGNIINSKTNKPENDVAVALSLLDETSKQDVVYTNENGVFYFHLKDRYRADNALIQIIEDNREDYILSVHDHEAINNNFKYNEILFTKEAKTLIKERSIHNQIENAFLEVKKDISTTYELPKEFYGNPPTVYVLDEYKRFPTIAESLTEIVDHAWYKKDKNKKLIFDVRAREFDPYAMDDIKPLVVVDGAYIKDHELVLNDSAYDVETISVLREEYYYGDEVYQGVVNIKTTSGDYYDKLKGSYIVNNKLFKPTPRKRYFKQNYDLQSDVSRIPDYRHQLLWIPEFRFNSQSFDLEFFTSDVKGDFEVMIEGYASNGDYVKVSKFFTVE